MWRNTRLETSAAPYLILQRVCGLELSSRSRSILSRDCCIPEEVMHQIVDSDS